MATASQLDEYFSLLDRVETARWSGHVRELVGLLVAADGPAAAVGDLCEIRARGEIFARRWWDSAMGACC